MPTSNPQPLPSFPGGARRVAPSLSMLAAEPVSGPWTPMPWDDLPRLDARGLLAQWHRLHAGQALPAPASPALLEGWLHYHAGDFERAAAIGHEQGSAGATLAHQATAIYANYLEPRESRRLALFIQVAQHAAAQAEAHPDDCHAIYWEAYALGRYSQGISVARALAQGLGSKVKRALERTIVLAPAHADAHIALGAFHAEVIDKVGALVGRMTYGVRAEDALTLFERGVALNPNSASAWIEYARGLTMLEGDAALPRAARLYERAAAIVPADARERLDAELAKAANIG